MGAQRSKPSDVSSMDAKDFAASAKLLLELDERDLSVVETADARNELESYIFESRNRLYEEKAVEKVSSEDERNDFLKILEESEEWIWDVEVESVGVFKGKVRELKKIGDVMFVKADEIEARPAAVDAAGKTLGNLLESVDMLRRNYTWINETEIEKLETKTKEAEQWLNDKIEAQSEKSLKDTPEFFSHDDGERRRRQRMKQLLPMPHHRQMKQMQLGMI